MPGDGVGKEVINESVRVLRRCLPGDDQLILEHFDFGATRFLHDGTTLSEEFVARLHDGQFHGIFFGAIGDARVPKNAHARPILLRMRQEFGMFANIRPTKLRDLRLCPLKAVTRLDQVDMVIVREATESLYTNSGGRAHRGTRSEVATDIMVSTYFAIERCTRYAFELARTRRQRVTLAHKANAIENAHGLWVEVFNQIKTEFPDVEARLLYCDVAGMHLIQRPWDFDVILCDNLIGDMLSDEASALEGGLGLAPSSTIMPGTRGLFEPVHGSAPDIAGKGIANPLAAILTAMMMLEFFHYFDHAQRIDRAVTECLLADETTPDLGGSLNTVQATDAVLRRITA